MIINPITKKDGSIYTNVELTRVFYKELVRLRDGIGAKTQKQKEKMEDAFYSICGGSQNAEEIMAFMKQIADEPDDEKAQKLLGRGLIPVSKKQSE